VHGGIAFTVEHGFHRFIRRGYMLDNLLGTADDLVREIGQNIVDAHLVPRTPGLIRPGA
jgi:alkylation response protein AidB-like acyl-CoA dehydrogenase